MRHRGQQLPFEPERKVRTPDHVIADLSYNFLERKVLQRGHWLDAPRNDYGIDAVMFHHNHRGEAESGEVRFQLKAKHRLLVAADREWIPQRVDIRDVRLWYFEPHPVILVVYDADRNRAFWLHVQQYIDRRPTIMDLDQGSVTMRIPIRHKVNLPAIDRFRKLSLDSVEQFQQHRRG